MIPQSTIRELEAVRCECCWSDHSKKVIFCTVKVHLISKSEGRRPNLTLGTVSICQFSTLQPTSQLGAGNCKRDLKGFKTNFETFVLQDSVMIWHLSSRECIKKHNYVHFWKNNSTSLANKLRFSDCHSNFPFHQWSM